VQTNFNTVIGGYNPDQWEETTGMRNSRGISDWKDITSGSPFLFYWVNDQIEIIKHRDDRIPFMRSDKNQLMGFEDGLYIDSAKNGLAYAYAWSGYWVHP
jgi:hypothetical protein